MDASSSAAPSAAQGSTAGSTPPQVSAEPPRSARLDPPQQGSTEDAAACRALVDAEEARRQARAEIQAQQKPLKDEIARCQEGTLASMQQGDIDSRKIDVQVEAESRSYYLRRKTVLTRKKVGAKEFPQVVRQVFDEVLASGGTLRRCEGELANRLAERLSGEASEKEVVTLDRAPRRKRKEEKEDREGGGEEAMDE